MNATAMTRQAFTQWLTRKRIAVNVWPYEIAPCTCGDTNCHGWRLVQRAVRPIAPITAATSMFAEAEP